MLRIDDLLTVDPMTTGQEEVFKGYKSGDHIVMSGSAGTGKTFTALYLALEEVLDRGLLLGRRFTLYDQWYQQEK